MISVADVETADAQVEHYDVALLLACETREEVTAMQRLAFEEVAVLRASELGELRAENERLKGQVAVLTSDLGAALAKADQTATDARRATLGGTR